MRLMKLLMKLRSCSADVLWSVLGVADADAAEGVSSAEAAHQEGEQGRDVRLSVTGEVPEKKFCVLSKKKRLPRERIKPV